MTWWYNDGHTTRGFECSVDVEPRGPGGVLLMEREITDLRRPQEKEELIYSEEMKTWLSPALTKTLECQKLWKQGVPVPSQVMDWLKHNSHKAMQEPSHMNSNFRTHCFKAPWCVVPNFVKNMVPRTVDLAAMEAELLQYTCRNSMLLLEALTHSSYSKANTPPNTRLATLCRWLVKTMLTKAVIQRTRFPMHTTRLAEEDVEAKEPLSHLCRIRAPWQRSRRTGRSVDVASRPICDSGEPVADRGIAKQRRPRQRRDADGFGQIVGVGERVLQSCGVRVRLLPDAHSKAHLTLF